MMIAIAQIFYVVAGSTLLAHRFDLGTEAGFGIAFALMAIMPVTK